MKRVKLFLAKLKAIGSIPMSDNGDTMKQDEGKDLFREDVLKKIDEIKQLCAGHSCIFRGESKDYGKISSGLYRHYCMPIGEDEREGGKRKENKLKEDRRKEDRQENVSLIDPEYFSTLDMTGILIDGAKQYFTNKESNIEILTELQHQGGKTALIDFTSCVYIALYFVCSANTGAHGRLLILDKSKLKEFDKRIIDWKPENTAPNQTGTYFVNPEGSSDRAAFQKSVFVFPVRGFLEKDEIFHEFKIKKELKEDILDYLFKKHGIDEKKIYDDLQGFIRRELSDPYIDFYQGVSLYKKGAYGQAIEKYKEVLKINPRHAQTYINRGVAKVDFGRHEEAIKDFDKGLKINPNFAEAYGNRGVARGALGQYKEAIKDYDKALEINPRYADAYYNRGAAKGKLGQPKEAIQDYGKALEINPRHAGAYNNRGLLRMDLGQLKEAIKDYDQALEINPKHAVSYYNRGISRGTLGQHEEAITDFDKALEINPQNAAAYQNRGVAKGELRQHKDAIKDYGKALEINPQEAGTYHNRGVSRGELGQHEEAIQDYDKALEINSRYADTYHNRGNAREQLGQYEEAIEDFDKTLEINPQNAAAYSKRAIARGALGQLKESIQDLEKALELYRQEGNDDLVRVVEKTLKQLKDKQQDASVKKDS